MRFKFSILKLLFIIPFLGMSQAPPVNTLKPQEWIDKMGTGHWWIFQISPAADTNITTQFSDKILDSLQTNFCINGGRLHWVVESSHHSAYDQNGELLQQSIDEVNNIIDEFMARDMAICLSIQFTDPDKIKDGMSQALRTRMKNAWAKVSEAFKDKSHNLAMCPVIEFHGWENLGNPARQDSLNVLYDELTTIFRTHNPTRIMSYKPWGAAKHAEFNSLDFPFGNDPLPNSGQPFYYVASFSGSAGLGDWNTWSPDMSQEDLEALHFQTINGGSSDPNKVWGIRAALEFRTNTGIPFWCDHWRPNYHKNYGTPQQWTMEQNMAYTEFFLNKISEIGSAGAFFQTRTFWSDQTNDLIRLDNNPTDEEKMSVMFMDFLKNRCEASTGINDNQFNNFGLKAYPNPAKEFVTIEGNIVHKLEIFDIFGRDLSRQLEIRTISDNVLRINVKQLNNGIYFIKSGKTIIKFLVKK